MAKRLSPLPRRRGVTLGISAFAAIVVAGALLGSSPAQASGNLSIDGIRVGSPSTIAGVVEARVAVRAPAGSKVTYSVAKPTKGSASITSKGVLTYTPTPAARHQAAKEGAAAAARSDVVAVTVTDAAGQRATKKVRVPILGANNAPVVSQVIMGQPDPKTGVVTGRVILMDPDGDPLTLALKSDTSTTFIRPDNSRIDHRARSLGALPPALVCPSSQGSLGVDPATGAFTYTPTATAPSSSAPTTDNFTVTATDGYGGTTSVPLSVPTASYGAGIQAPNPSTGVVTGG